MGSSMGSDGFRNCVKCSVSAFCCDSAAILRWVPSGFTWVPTRESLGVIDLFVVLVPVDRI